MSGVASEAVEPVAIPELSTAGGAAIDAPPGGVDLCESEADEHETVMTYDPNAHVPVVVITVWVVSMLALAVYAYLYYFGDLAKWVRP
jgi:hypothetical protein